MNRKLLLKMLIIITLIILFFHIKPTTISKKIDVDIDNYTKLTAIVHGPGELYLGKEIEITDKQTMKKLFEYLNKLKIGRSIASEFDVTGLKHYILIFNRVDGETTLINIYNEKHIGIDKYKDSKTYCVWFDEIDLEYIYECLQLSQTQSLN